MSYPVIPSMRMPYDIDGTEIGFSQLDSLYYDYSALVGLGLQRWLTEDEKTKLNREVPAITFGGFNEQFAMWFFFPEVREITHVAFVFQSFAAPITLQPWIHGSDDTTNGMDGTWELATHVFPGHSSNRDSWRTHLFEVSFSKPIKVLRIGMWPLPRQSETHIVHVYGMKAVGQTPDDIIFTDTAGVETTAVMEFGDRPEGTTEFSTFKIKNASGTKIANAINLQLNSPDFLMSYAMSGPWVSVIDIPALPPGALSSTIYVKNELPPPLLILGPKAARIIVTVGSWT